MREIEKRVLEAVDRRLTLGDGKHPVDAFVQQTYRTHLEHVAEHLVGMWMNRPDDDEPTLSPIQAHGAAIIARVGMLMEMERRGLSAMDDRPKGGKDGQGKD